MWKRTLEVLILLFAVGGLAALYQAPNEPPAPAPSPPPTTAPSTAPARPARPLSRWGSIPCQVLLDQGHLRLRFKNDGPDDFIIQTGGGIGRYHLTSVGPERIAIQADYSGCPSTSIHYCYHTQSLLVPAGKSVILDLGKAPEALQGMPERVPGEYFTYKPAPQPKRATRQRPEVLTCRFQPGSAG